MEKVTLNISGRIFEFDRDLLDDKPSGKLTEMCQEATEFKRPLEFAISRSPTCFEAVLSYYQTGELHIPPAICPGAFRREMEFWGLGFETLPECCLFRYQAFLDEEETRRNFLCETTPLNPVAHLAETTVPIPSAHRLPLREKVWRVVDNQEVSWKARIYFVTVFLMILLSIFSLAYSTEPSMRRDVSYCELLEYMESTEDQYTEKVRTVLGNPDCSGPPTWSANPTEEEIFNEELLKNYEYFYEHEGQWYWPWTWPWNDGDSGNSSWDGQQRKRRNVGAGPSNSPSPVTSSSAPPVISPSNQPSLVTPQPVKQKIIIPKISVPKFIFRILDLCTNIFFSIDFILRIFSCPSILRYFRSPINVMDALALVATYVNLIIVSVKIEYRYKPSPFNSFLDFAQVFRALRMFRVVKNVRASKVLAYSLSQDLRDMTLLMALLFVGISTFACLFFYAEPRDNIISIPNAWYWAIVTMTTVGYGDISPVTGFGRVIACICAICGVLLLAVTLPMFVNNFLTLYQVSCVNDAIEKRKKERLDLLSKQIAENNLEKPAEYESPKHAQTLKPDRIFFVKPASET